MGKPPKVDGYEGRLSLRWMRSSSTYLSTLSYRHWSDGRYTPCFTSGSRWTLLTNDEWFDRNLTRLAREVAAEARALDEDDESGQFQLWTPPGHHDPRMWDRPLE